MTRPGIALALLTSVTLVGCGGGSGGGSSTSASTVAGSTSGTTATTTTNTTPPPATPPPATPPPPAGPQFRVAGWHRSTAAADATTYANVGNGLDEVNLFIYRLNADGSISGAENAARLAQLRQGGAEVIPTVMDLSNNGVFDAVLADPAKQRRAIQEIVAKLDQFGYDGIDTDFEQAKTATRDAYTRFNRDLAAAVHARGKVFSLTIPGKRADTPNWVGYDYRALAAEADRVKIMCYGYSGPWSANPGPICPTTWISRVLDYARTTMPLSKIQVGIPFYGYDWPANGGTVSSVTWSSVQSRLQRASASGIRFDATLGESTFTYTDDAGVSHTVWFQDPRSIAAKCETTKQYGCAGIAIWSLGYDSPRFWDEIRRVLK